MSQQVDTREPKNGFGITALCLALVGLVFGLIPLTGFIAVICGALAVLFGLLGVGRAGRGEATNRKMNWIATVLGVGALALGIWGVSIVVNTVDEIDQEMTELEADLNDLKTE